MKRKKGFWVKCLLAMLMLVLTVIAAAWFVLPMVNARYYWEKAAFHTIQECSSIPQDRVDFTQPSRQYLKAVVDKAQVDGRSVLILPGGFGMAFTKESASTNGTVAGNLDAYFMGSMRRSLDYSGNDEELAFSLPDFFEGTGQVTQDTLEQSLGIRLLSGKREDSELLDQILHIFLDHPMEYISRDKEEVVIGVKVPADNIENLLKICSSNIKNIPGRLPVSWTKWLLEYQPEGQNVTIICRIDRKMELTEIEIPNLLDFCLNRISSDGTIEGEATICLGTDKMEARIKLLGSTEENGFSYQVPSLEIIYTEPGHEYILGLSGLYTKTQLEESFKLFKSQESVQFNIEQIESLKQKFIKDMSDLGFKS